MANSEHRKSALGKPTKLSWIAHRSKLRIVDKDERLCWSEPSGATKLENDDEEGRQAYQLEAYQLEESQPEDSFVPLRASFFSTWPLELEPRVSHRLHPV